ncbi:MAG: DUF6285 domain-containing protein [Myxococcota bacterium]
MLDRPDAATLLEAVAAYLEKDARPAIADAGLAFRALIAANLCRVVAAEARGGEAYQEKALETGAALLGTTATLTGTQAERAAALAEVERALAERIRAGALPLSASTVEGLMEMLAGELAIVSPRFDQALQIEGH